MSDQPKITRRQLQKEDTRRIILQTAYALFAEKGYTKTTMRTLAQRAGVGLGTIFKHFPDKSSLLVAAFQEDLGMIIRAAFRSLPKSGIKKQLLHITRKIYDFYEKNPIFSRTLIKETIFMQGKPGEILDDQLLTFLNDISELLMKAVKRGELPPDTHPQEGALVFGSFYFTGLLMGLKQPRFDTKEQLRIVEALIDHYLIRS